MELLSKLIHLTQNAQLIKAVLLIGDSWLALNLICWMLGAIGLSAMGRKKHLTPRLPAYLPGGQIWYTLKLAGHPTKQIEHLLWWCPTLTFAAVAALLWGIVLYLGQGGTALFGLLGLALLLLIIALVFYILIREMELRAVGSLLRSKPLFALAVIGTVLGVPIQRVLLFGGRNNSHNTKPKGKNLAK